MMRSRAAVLAVCALLSAASLSFAGYSNGQPAAAVTGQTVLTGSGINGAAGVGAGGYSSPAGIWSDGTTLIVADTANNRVLIYNSVPTADGVAADVVVGQPDAVSSVANQGGAPAANTLSFPTGVYFDGASLYVADTGNNRVLIYYGLPNSNNIPADMVVGQAFVSSGAANQGGAVGANTLSGPQGVYSDGVALYVADTGNNRVLIYNAVPASPNALADVVVGQSTTTVGSVNANTTTKAYTLSGPTSVRAKSGSLYVADRGNNRALIYTPVPAVAATSATVVVGQVFLTSAAANQGTTVSSMTLSGPTGLDTDGTRLFIADAGNNRALIYNAIPAGNGVGANVAVGQTSLKAGLANQGASRPSASTLSAPFGVAYDGTQLYVGDRGNNRALLYNPLPSASGASAVYVEGQADFKTSSANQATSRPSASVLFRPNGARTDGTRLFVADRFNNRVLVFNAEPILDGVPADAVVGQPNMSTGSANMGGISAGSLSSPVGVFGDGTRLFVADTGNNRVLGYSAVPSTNGVAASFVVGQPTFSSGTFNRGGAPTAQTLALPTDVVSDGTSLYVADRSNNRVLVYSPVPSASNPTAGLVLGQTGMTTGSANQGGLSAFSLSGPTGLSNDGKRLFVADQLNNRVLIYTLPLTTSHSSATVVVGQPNMTSNLPNQGLSAPTAATLRFPSSVHSDGTSLYVADSANNRVLVYAPIPTVNGAAATTVIGQSSFTTFATNQGLSVAGNTIANPAGVSVDSATGRMYVGDTNSNRVLLYLPSVVAPVGGSASSATVASPISPLLVQASLPSGVLPSPANMTLGLQSVFPAPSSAAQPARGTGIGFSIALDQPLQPAGLVTVSASYRPADVAGFDRSRLVLARYDDPSGLWVPLSSVDDVSGGRVIAQTNHFSLFQIMQVDPTGNDLSNARVFPNPFQPPAGHTAMTFATLPAGARVRIYTVTGLVLKDLSADVNGIARWDGTNQAGAPVASGVYYAYLQAGARSRMFTVAVQR